MDQIGVGVIGVGNIARNYHLPAIAACDGARLVGIADVIEARAHEVAAQFGFAHAFDDYRRLLDRSDVHAVFIFTQYGPRQELVPACAAAGKHIFTQKPLAASSAIAEELVQAARQHQVRLVTSFMHNYFPETRVTSRLLQEGAIGALEFVRQRNAIGSNFARAYELGGGTWDIGPHGVGMIHHLTGSRIVRVQAMMDMANRPPAERELKDSRPVDTRAIMNYTLANGCLVTHEVHWTARAGTTAWLTELFGDRGGILLRPHIGDGSVALFQRAERPAGARNQWQYPPIEPEQPRGRFHHQLFIDDVRFDRYESASPEDGLATVRVLEAAYQSAVSGHAVVVRHT